MTMFRAAAFALVLTALPGSRTVHAQSGTPFCFRGRALPRCQAFVLTEVGLYRRAVATRQSYPDQDRPLSSPELDSHVSWDLGYMRNLDRAQAVGGTIMLGTGDAGVRAAAKARYRRWIGREDGGGDGTLDLSLGVLTAGLRSPGVAPPDNPGTGFSYVSRGVGLTGEATLGVGDLIGASVRAEVLRANQRTAAAAYVGVRLGSYPAILASTVGALGLLLLARSSLGG